MPIACLSGTLFSIFSNLDITMTTAPSPLNDAPARRALWRYALAIIVASLVPFVLWPSLADKATESDFMPHRFCYMNTPGLNLGQRERRCSNRAVLHRHCGDVGNAAASDKAEYPVLVGISCLRAVYCGLWRHAPDGSADCVEALLLAL